MLLSKWMPERLNAFDRFNRVMEEMFRNYEPETALWIPNVDIKETTKEYFFTVEVPGVPKENIKVELQGDVLFISGNRVFDKEEKKEDYIRIERGFGEFQRQFTLDLPVRADGIVAELKDGILKVRAPKTEAVVST